MRFGAFIHIDQLGGGAFLDFLAHGAGEAFQGTLGNAHGASLFFRSTTNDDNASAFIQLANHRVEEVPQGFQFVRALDAGGVEYQAFEFGIVIAIGAVFYAYTESLKWIDALYFTVVTATTVGFGDYCPETTSGEYLFI